MEAPSDVVPISPTKLRLLRAVSGPTQGPHGASRTQPVEHMRRTQSSPPLRSPCSARPKSMGGRPRPCRTRTTSGASRATCPTCRPCSAWPPPPPRPWRPSVAPRSTQVPATQRTASACRSQRYALGSSTRYHARPRLLRLHLPPQVQSRRRRWLARATPRRWMPAARSSLPTAPMRWQQHWVLLTSPAA